MPAAPRGVKKPNATERPPLSRKPLPGQKQFRPEHDYLAPLTCLGNREAFHRSAISSPDRKSTRLNSSHVRISYAVFCLKKKKKKDRCTVGHACATINRDSL